MHTCICVYDESICMCYLTSVDVRGKFVGINSLLLLGGSQKLDPGPLA